MYKQNLQFIWIYTSDALEVTSYQTIHRYVDAAISRRLCDTVDHCHHTEED